MSHASYMMSQLNQIHAGGEYPAIIQIFSPDGKKSNCINIDDATFQKIARILIDAAMAQDEAEGKT